MLNDFLKFAHLILLIMGISGFYEVLASNKIKLASGFEVIVDAMIFMVLIQIGNGAALYYLIRRKDQS